MNKKIISLFVATAIMGGSFVFVKQASAKTTGILKANKTTTVNINAKKNNTKTKVKARTKVTAEQSVGIAKAAVKKYFGYDMSKTKSESKVDYFDYSTDNRFWNVKLVDKNGFFTVNVDEGDGKVFLVSQGRKDIKLNKRPISKDKALKTALAFIKRTEPTKASKIKLTDQSFEYKYNTQDVEYYVFEFKGVNVKKVNNDRYMSIKVNTYGNYISDMTLLWK